MRMPMDMINKINPERDNWNLKVRVVRLWSVPHFSAQLLPSSLELILIDEAGCKIQATVRRVMIARFKDQLVEGRVYVMNLFSVVPNIGCYRATSHEYKLVFQFRTTVRPDTCEFIPKLGLDIIPIADLLQRSEDSDFLVDVMGLLTSVTDEKEYEKDGKKTKMVVIELGENDDRICCALFGDYVDQLNRYLSSGYAEQPVLLLQLAKVKVYRGKVGLQNVMFASKLGFNLDIPEVASFRQSSIPQGLMASQPMGFVDAGKKVDIEEDFVRLTPRCTIKSLEDDVMEGAFVVIGQITEIVEDGPWWYSACVCGRRVIAESGLYFCQFCKTHVTNVTPRFRVKVLVEDPSGATIFVLFDREATYLLKKTCADL